MLTCMVAVSPQRLHQVEISKLMKLHKCLQNLNVEVISKNNEKKCLIISSYFLICSKLHLQRYTHLFLFEVNQKTVQTLKVSVDFHFLRFLHISVSHQLQNMHKKIFFGNKNHRLKTCKGLKKAAVGA